MPDREGRAPTVGNAGRGSGVATAIPGVAPGPGKQTLVQQLGSGAPAPRSSGPSKIVQLEGQAAEAKLAELGGKLITDPDFSDGHPAITGSHVQYTVLGPTSLTVRIGVHQWMHDGPD